MIILLAIVLGLHIQGKPLSLQKRFQVALHEYLEPSKPVPVARKGKYLRISPESSAEFESIAKESGSKPLAIEAWALALVSSAKDLARENQLLDRVLAAKTFSKDQFKVIYLFAEEFSHRANTFAASSRVVKILDLLMKSAPTKNECAELLLFKADAMADTSDLKWDVYNRLVEQYGGTPASSSAHNILIRKKNLQAGDQFPDFISKDSNGQKFQLSNSRGKVVVLEFWANWCPSCQRTIPVMQGVEKEFSGQNVEFVGVNSDGDASVVKEIQAKWGMTTRTLVDGSPSGPISVRYAIMAWPSFFVIGKEGKVVFRSSGINAPGMTAAIRDALK